MGTFLSRPRNRATWDADEIELLCSELSLRKPIRDIAAQLGRSQEAVAAKARQLDRLGQPSL